MTLSLARSLIREVVAVLVSYHLVNLFILYMHSIIFNSLFTCVVSQSPLPAPALAGGRFPPGSPLCFGCFRAAAGAGSHGRNLGT